MSELACIYINVCNVFGPQGPSQGQARVKDGVLTELQWRSGGDYKEEQEHRDTETAKMRMPEPKEGKVTATGGGLCASGLLKLGSVRRSLLKKGLFVRFAIATTLKSFLPSPIFKQPSQHSLVHNWLTRSYSSRRGQLSTCLCVRPHCVCVCLVVV